MNKPKGLNTMLDTFLICVLISLIHAVFVRTFLPVVWAANWANLRSSMGRYVALVLLISVLFGATVWMLLITYVGTWGWIGLVVSETYSLYRVYKLNEEV